MVNDLSAASLLLGMDAGTVTNNTDTVEGRYLHRAVDRPGRAAPLPQDGDLIAARSLMLCSEGLGLIARVDLLEGTGGTVRPVDMKHGSPPHLPFVRRSVESCTCARIASPKST